MRVVRQKSMKSVFHLLIYKEIFKFDKILNVKVNLANFGNTAGIKLWILTNFDDKPHQLRIINS